MNYHVKEDIQLFTLLTEVTTNELVDALGISKNTILAILEDKYPSNKETYEKIYSYLYNHRYYLNESKVKEYKSVFENNLILIHGAKNEIKAINPTGSRPTCDFGQGFYLLKEYDPALEFVCEYNDASIYLFLLDNNDLNILEFDATLEWMLAICYYRGFINAYKDNKIIKDVISKIEKADIIIAPIADNHMFYIIQAFCRGDITTIEAISSLEASSLGKQYVLKTNKALNALKPLERLYLCQEEKNKMSSSLKNRSKEIDNNLQQMKRKHKGEGQYIDELFL